MKHILNKTTLALATAGWLAAGLAHADISLPVSNFTDGSLVYNTAFPTNICIDLSRATNSVWTDSTTGTNAGRGIYDAEKWAVVFKYTSVNIGANVTLCFTNHPSHAPVVWIVEGNVTINGRVSLDGEPGNTFARHTEPGPGGGYGGIGETSNALLGSDGVGWGGGKGNTFAGPASFASEGVLNISGGGLGGVLAGSIGSTYGSASCLPLIGGSGGAGTYEPGTPRSEFAINRANLSGGGGGGALLVASGRTVTINGTITANGGQQTSVSFEPGRGSGAGGSGGSIRIVCESLAGIGNLQAICPNVGLSVAHLPQAYSYAISSLGGSGRIRIETVRNQMGGLTTVPGPSVVPLSGVPQLWPAPAAPSVRIQRVAQTAITPTPLGNIDSGFTDAQINAGPNETEVIVEGANLTDQAQVDVRVVPKFGASQVVRCSYLGTTNALTYWRAVARFAPDLSVLQARAVGP